jgi:hypothetical protein
MSYFDFKRLINKYSSSFTLKVPSEGSFVGGQYEVTYTEKELTGAILGFSMRKIYQSGGYLTSQDRHLFIEQPVEHALSGALVVFNGNVYSIEEDSENGNERFTGVYSYVLRRKQP